MSVTLLATQVPLPTTFSTLDLLDDAENSTGLNGCEVLRKFAQGDDTTVPSYLNRDMFAIELLGRYGAGSYGIAKGLAIATAASLNLPVTAGHFMLDVPVEIPAATSINLPDNTARVFVFIQQDGTLAYSTSPTIGLPSQAYGLLGSCVTSGGVITSVDDSGVLRLRGGVVWRQTADIGAPFDAPPSTISFWTLTLGGWYLWNGTSYLGVGEVLKTIQAVTANATDTSAQRGWFTTNEGASSKPVRGLEAAQAGVQRTFIIQDSDGMRIQANSGDTVRLGTSVSSSGGYIESTEVGATVTLLAINVTEWIAIAFNGTWSIA